MTITDTDAFEAMRTHDQTLDDRTQALAAPVARAVTNDDTAYAPRIAGLIAYFADEVLPSALGEVRSINQVARARADLAGTVVEINAEHRSLAFALEGLAGSPNGPCASDQTDKVAALFTAHVATENEIFLPRLLEGANVQLAELLMQMQRLTNAAQHEGSLSDDASTPDLVSMLSHVGMKEVTK